MIDLIQTVTIGMLTFAVIFLVYRVTALTNELNYLYEKMAGWNAVVIG